ncbi:MAG: LPS export ABC transporter ATP-binding protein [Armatimonadetes bacterium]|nr:LPS export ABC transporter ATP-binding protein [Armatimonadota bacterium]
MSEDAGGATLHALGLMKRYRSRQVVKDVSFELRPGEIFGLLGPNGAGKTTTFHMIVGLVRPNGGQVYLNGELITRLPVNRRALAGINYLAQEPSIFRKLSVEENLALILEQHGVARADRRERVDRLLEEFRLAPLRRQPAYTLSGGERRRVEIARALAMWPRFVLLDEPFTGVDPLSIQDIQDMIHYLRDQGIGVLISDHNVRETLEITNRAAIMFDGRILLEGTSAELTSSEEARNLYLGDRFRL